MFHVPQDSIILLITYTNISKQKSTACSLLKLLSLMPYILHIVSTKYIAQGTCKSMTFYVIKLKQLTDSI